MHFSFDRIYVDWWRDLRSNIPDFVTIHRGSFLEGRGKP